MNDKKDEEEAHAEMAVKDVNESELEMPRKKNEENLNVRAAVVHMIGDMIQSIGVIIAAVIIYINEDWKIADPICTFLFSILVMFTTVPVFTDCMRILMETAPTDLETLDVLNALRQLDFVQEVHDFHIWALSSEKPVLSAHVVTDLNPSVALFRLTQILVNDFNIHHSTIQIESSKSTHNPSHGMLRCISEHKF